MSEQLIAIAALALLTQVAVAETLTDPMRPWHAAPAAITERVAGMRYELSAILYSPERRVAIVNGRAVSEGERIGNARVSRIRRGRVELDTGERTLTLALAKSPHQTRSRSPQ